jgi:hypothetical protein
MTGPAWHHSRVPPISELSRIEPIYLDRLEKQGIFTTGILLEVSETATRRQYLADHVGASLTEVATWRDEALMLNLAAFGPLEHRILARGGYPGLESMLRTDLPTFQAGVRRAAQDLKVEAPEDLTMTGWWEQARTLETLPEPRVEVESDIAGGILRFIFGVLVGIGGAVVATVAAPSGSAIASVLVVGAVMAAAGIIGAFVAPGVAGFGGLVVGGFPLLALLLGKGVLIGLPNTPFWQDTGITFPLGPGLGMAALVAGWIVGWAVRRARGRGLLPAVRRPA